MNERLKTWIPESSSLFNNWACWVVFIILSTSYKMQSAFVLSFQHLNTPERVHCQIWFLLVQRATMWCGTFYSAVVWASTVTDAYSMCRSAMLDVGCKAHWFHPRAVSCQSCFCLMRSLRGSFDSRLALTDMLHHCHSAIYCTVPWHEVKHVHPIAGCVQFQKNSSLPLKLDIFKSATCPFTDVHTKAHRVLALYKMGNHSNNTLTSHCQTRSHTHQPLRSIRLLRSNTSSIELYWSKECIQ